MRNYMEFKMKEPLKTKTGEYRKLLQLLKIIASIYICLFTTLAYSTEEEPSHLGGDPGGGHYLLTEENKWKLLDDVERKEVLDFIKHPDKVHFEEVTSIIVKLQKAVPEFANQLKKVLAKNWFKLPYEIRCEDADSVINDDSIQAGACQYPYDIFVNTDKYSTDPVGLIIHELVQGIRLEKNMTRNKNNRVSKMAVRAIKNAIDKWINIESTDLEAKLANELRKYNFGNYQTYSQQQEEIMAAKQRNQKLKEHDAIYAKAKNLYDKYCTVTINPPESTEVSEDLIQNINLAISAIDELLLNFESVRNFPELGGNTLRGQKAFQYSSINPVEDMKRQCNQVLEN